MNATVDTVKTTLKEQYAALPVKQRQWLLGTIALIIILTMAGLYAWCQQFAATHHQRLLEGQSTLTWMNAQESAVAALVTSETDTSDPRSLLSITRTAAAANDVVVAHYRMKDEVGLRIRVDASPFPNALAWLEALRLTEGVHIQQLTLNSTATPGLVNVSLELSR